MRLEFAAASDVGRVRSQNEDSFVAGGGLFAVCDGMGGARAGEVASEAACRALLALPPGPVDAGQLGAAIDEANAAILARSAVEPDLRGMGTTMTTALAGEHHLLIGHVGDSRAYLWHAGLLRQVTQDHSLVGEMVRSGQLTPEQAAVHPYRSVITRALGTEESVRPDIFSLPVEPGDRLLLCSDGLSGMLPFDEIGRLLGGAESAADAADGLVASALEAGGEDNVTVVVVFVREGDPDPADPGGSGAASRGDVRVGPESRAPAATKHGRLRSALPREWGGSAGGTAGWLRRHRVWLIVAAVVVVLGLVVGGFALFNSTVYFVGARDDQVLLYRGMPYSVLGIDLYRSVEAGAARYSTLDPATKAKVDANELVTKEEGQNFLRALGVAP